MHAKPGPIRVWGGGVAEGLSGGRNQKKNGKLPFLYAGISQFHHEKVLVEDIWQAGTFFFGGTITIKNLDCHPDFVFFFFKELMSHQQPLH